MKTKPGAEFARWFGAACLLALLVGVFAGCRRQESAYYQGYLEGEYIYVGPALAGRLQTLAVEKGARVTVGAPLFALEREAEIAAKNEATGRLAQAKARLEDLQKGQRPSELAALQARLAQARTAVELSGRELRRVETLHRAHAVSDDELDRASLNDRRNREVVAELESQFTTAQLGARADALTAAEADLTAAGAALARAEWSVEQKQVAAPVDALVYDTIFRVGELVPAGQPVVALLPPANVKVRFYVPESAVAALRRDVAVRVRIDGRPAPLEARVSFVSPQAEFTPPVIYSRESRTKLVYRVEAVFAPAVAAELHPGQPVEVEPLR